MESGRPVLWTWQSIAGLAFLGIVGTGLAYAVWFSLLPRIPLVRIGALLFLVPVVGAAQAWLLATAWGRSSW